MPDPVNRDSRVLIAIVHWNTPELLEACIDSLRVLPADRVSILILDNASAGGPPVVTPGAGPAIDVLALPANIGFAGAAEAALAALRDGAFDALWLLNADVVVEPGTFLALEQAAHLEPDAVIGCVVMDAQGQHIRMPEKFLHADRRWRFGWRDRPIAPDPPGPPLLSVQAVHGAAMRVPRSVIDAWGLFDPAFFLYCEEIDFCLRLSKLGVPIRLAKSARVRHVGSGASVRQPGVQHVLDYYRTRNELVLWRRHAPFWLPWIVSRKLARLVVTTLRFDPSSSKRWCGFFDGLRGRLGKRFAPESAWRRP